MELNPILEQLGSYPIALIHQRARARVEAGLPTYDFSIGDPREPTPEMIQTALREAVPEVSQYPLTAGISELRQAIAAYLDRRLGVTIDPETQVMPTSGSKEAVFNTPLAFIDRSATKRTVVYPTPGYPIYERGALFAGADIHPVVLEGDFVQRVDMVPDDVWQRARIVWSCSPHNPAGSVMSGDNLAAHVERSRSSGALFFADECYLDVYEEDAFPEGPASVLQVAGPGAPGVLSFLSLSKRSGMTGYRSGAMVGDPEIIGALKKLRTATGTASPEFVQRAAVVAWRDDAHAAQRRKIFAAKRAILGEAFADLGLRVVASRAGLYLWVEVGDDMAATERLLEHGVVVSPGRFFGRGGEGHLRLALVPALDECEAAADALRRALR
jgi:succinyldiaminopimelate transaminase